MNTYTYAATCRDGKLTRYAFQCGGIVNIEVDDNNRSSIWMDHGVYQVGGFYKGEHFRTAFTRKNQAYKAANIVNQDN